MTRVTEMSKQGYRLNERQLRALTTNERPALDKQGKTVISDSICNAAPAAMSSFPSMAAPPN